MAHKMTLQAKVMMKAIASEVILAYPPPAATVRGACPTMYIQMKIIHYVAYRALFRTFWAIGLFFLASQVPRKHSVIVGIELCMWGVCGHVVSAVGYTGTDRNVPMRHLHCVNQCSAFHRPGSAQFSVGAQ